MRRAAAVLSLLVACAGAGGSGASGASATATPTATYSAPPSTPALRAYAQGERGGETATGNANANSTANANANAAPTPDNSVRAERRPAPPAGVEARPSEPLSPPTTVQQRFPELVAAAEKAVGTRFRVPLPVQELDAAALRALAEAEVRSVPAASWAELGRVLAAVGALASRDDLTAAAVEVRAAQTVARLDAAGHALLLGPGALDAQRKLQPAASPVVLGMLVRALAAQSGAAPPPAPDGDDAREAALLLSEGDATLAVLRAGEAPVTSAALPGLMERFRASGQGGLEKVPPFVRELLVARFTDGALLADALDRSGGRALVTRALAAPPATSEGSLHPEKYLSGERPARLALPADDSILRSRGYARVAERTLGELAIRSWAGLWLGPQGGARAGAGWDGDRAAVYGKAGAPDVLLWAAASDVEADAENLQGALWAIEGRRAPARRSGDCRVYERGELADAVCRKGRVTGLVRDAPADVAVFLAGELASVKPEEAPPAPALPGARFVPASGGVVATSRGREEGRRYVHPELAYALTRPAAPPLRFVPGPTSTGSEVTPVILEPPEGGARLRVSVTPVEANGVELAARVSRGLASGLARGQMAPASQVRRADGRESWVSRFSGQGASGSVLVVAGDGRTYVLVATWSERTPQPTVDALAAAQRSLEVLPAGR